MTHLARAEFGTRFVDALPAGAAYSLVAPGAVGRPRLVGWSREVAEELGFAPPDDADLAVLAGNVIPGGARPYAARYGGHQFGHWAGQLGDGRAIGLGDVNGREVQLKGAGPTPYSRGADGRAVLRSSLREFVCSEAMHHLGVPTTRALAVVTTGTPVVRDMFYDGRAGPEPGAICTRVAPSFVRIGNFELFAATGDLTSLRTLADWVIATHFPEVKAADYPAFFAAVVARTARLMSAWMTKGFVHGVMNTDNLSILGLTIDYGPYGWLEEYDPSWTPNTTDLPGRRYAFGRQPAVAEWNLAQLGSALATMDEDLVPALRAALDGFAPTYAAENERAFAQKLGFAAFGDEADRELFADLDRLMREGKADFTRVYRELAGFDGDVENFLDDVLYVPPQPEMTARWAAWLTAYAARARREDPLIRRRSMNAVNPRFVPRNWLLQEAIEMATAGDFARVEDLLETFRRPYHEQPGRDAFAAKRPEWARVKAGCSTLSCSS